MGAGALALVLGACSLDTGGFTGSVTKAQLEYDGQEPSGSGQDRLLELVEARLAAVGIDEPKIEEKSEGLFLEVGDYDRGTVERGLEVASRVGRLRIRPVISIRDGSREDITSPDGDVADDRIVLQQTDPAGAVVTYELGPAVGPDRIGAVAGTTTEAGRWGVTLDLQDDAADALTDIAQACQAKQPRCRSGRVAFVVDSVVIAALSPGELPTDGNSVKLFGGLEETSARDLATVLQHGPLPVGLTVGKIETVE